MPVIMKLRLIIAIVSTILEEVLIAFLFLWVLGQMEVYIPPVALIVVLILWTIAAVVMYRAGSKALDRRPASGLGTMVGSRGVVVRPLTPQGMIRIGAELWLAQSPTGEINEGEEVIVTAQQGLKLTVKPVNK